MPPITTFRADSNYGGHTRPKQTPLYRGAWIFQRPDNFRHRLRAPKYDDRPKHGHNLYKTKALTDAPTPGLSHLFIANVQGYRHGSQPELSDRRQSSSSSSDTYQRCHAPIRIAPMGERTNQHLAVCGLPAVYTYDSISCVTDRLQL